MSVHVSLTVNGAPVAADLPAETLLVDFLRNQLRLTGTHVGCDTSQCGACTVLLDGRAVKACSLLAVQAQDATVVTIEGLASDGALHPMQAAFREHHGLQCGFCTPGMVMSACAIDTTGGVPDEAAIRRALDGNFCRCTGYHNIVRAVQSGLAAMQAKGGRS
ncbi:carbon monoxide dehydrogenase [Pandoraea terrae]|uniref:Carbon monoxide dehydrogenase n=1 Tax=Pandoraea terrae TaxID=1537710 RepID=A0A5E4URE0_9BURK|nr:(2Fe-2S)-binding protein [Pandoraea terrae]VVE02124.1 carbon monoxide dehydrogenase [Pandoraea terrae]